jgi:hypothetical protein
MVGDHEADLGATQAGQPVRALLHRGEIELRLAVVLIRGHPERRDGVEAELGEIARHRIDDADHDFLRRLGVSGGRDREQGHEASRTPEKRSHVACGGPPQSLD